MPALPSTQGERLPPQTQRQAAQKSAHRLSAWEQGESSPDPDTPWNSRLEMTFRAPSVCL